jgi:CheY-like chemotaxis protein
MKPHAPIPVVASSAQMRILVVEDHAHTRNAIVRILTLRGHDVHGAESIAEAKAVVAKSRLDLLICDLGLPDGHGSELLSYIKERQAISSVALSGDGMEAQIIESGKAGFDLHLVKPVSIPVLEQAISMLAQRRMAVGKTPI